MLYPETLYQRLCTQVTNQDHFSVSKWLTSSRQERDISLLIWFQTANFLIVCDLDNKISQYVRKQQSSKWTLCSCSVFSEEILNPVNFATGFICVSYSSLMNGRAESDLNFTFSDRILAPTLLLSEGRWHRKRAQAWQRVDMIHALIQQRLTESLLWACAGYWKFCDEQNCLFLKKLSDS